MWVSCPKWKSWQKGSGAVGGPVADAPFPKQGDKVPAWERDSNAMKLENYWDENWDFLSLWNETFYVKKLKIEY